MRGSGNGSNFTKLRRVMQVMQRWALIYLMLIAPLLKIQAGMRLDAFARDHNQLFAVRREPPRPCSGAGPGCSPEKWVHHRRTFASSGW